MNYEKFIETVPEETGVFIKKLLSYLNYFNDEKLKCDNTFIENENIKILLLMLYVLAQEEKYKIIFAQCGLNIDNFFSSMKKIPYSSDIEYYEAYNSQTFITYMDKILYSKDVTSYSFLTPLAYLVNIMDSCSDFSYQSVFSFLLNKKNLSNFANNLTKTYKDMILDNNRKIRIIHFNNLNNEAVSYLEVAIKIRTILCNKKNELVDSISEEDLIPLSLLIAIFFTKNDEAENIVQILSDDDMTLNKILSKIGPLSFTREYVENQIADYNILIKEYSKYYSNTKEETIKNIFEKLFKEKNYTIVEHLFDNLLIPFDEFVNFGVKYQRWIHNNFFHEIPNDTEKYVTFVVKTFKYLKTNLNEKWNDNLLFDEEEFILLSFYLASAYFDTNLSKFFKINGITYKKVLKLLNLDIKLEDIDATELDYDFCTNKIKEFIYKYCSNCNFSNLTISEIENNLSDLNFTKCRFLHNIFEEITGTKLDTCFEKQMQKNIEEEKKKENYKIQEEYFKGLPVETVCFLEQVISNHTSFKIEEPISKDDYTILILIITILNLNDNLMRDFFNFLGFNFSKLISFTNLQSCKETSEDVSELIDNYDKFIFKGFNEGKSKEEITIYSIAKNIFNASLNDSLFVNKLFDYFNVSRGSYNKFGDLYQEFLKGKAKQEQINQYNKKVFSLDFKQKSFFNSVLKIHQKLKQKDFTDIKAIAILLAIFYSNHNILKFLEKYKLTKEMVLSYLNLPSDFLDDIDDYQIDYDIFEAYYSDLSEQDIKDIFDNLAIKKMIEDLKINYEFLLKEIETGQDYENSLSLNDRIKFLSEKPIDILNLDDIQSVISYGNNLGIHTKYIYDEIPKLMLSDVTNESIASINEVINQIYTAKPKEEKPKNFFERLFAIEVTEEPEIVINPVALEELNKRITDNIKKLAEELLKYDMIRKYIETYRKKNDSYLDEISKTIDNLLTKVNGLNPNDDNEYAEFLTSSSNLQIVKNKLERFKTSRVLMQQELVKINQAIVNHFATINALEMAKNDLIPLIMAELTIGKGRNTENQALETTQNIFGLFKSLLDKNVEEANYNLELLRNSNISTETLATINKDIATYLNGITPELVLPETEKQKKLKGPSQS